MIKDFNLLFIFLLSTFCLTAQDRISGEVSATRSAVIAQNGMVCTSQPLASQIGLDILKNGGNAIDAAIAANAALGLMEPTGCGIGGDIFAIVWDAKTQKLYGLNGSGRSPKSLTLQYFKDNGIEQIPPFGPLPVSVPGTVDGWYELHKKFGKTPMADILAPAIAYAENGFPVSQLISYYINLTAKRFKSYDNFPETWMPGGKAPQEGDLFKNKYLADTYRAIANGGRDAFYKGQIAETIATFIKSKGGFLSKEDLAAHKSEWVEPVGTNYRGYDLWELPPNGQGIAALQMLNILEDYDIGGMGFGSADYIHYLTEAKKLAYEDRAKFYADMDFNKIPVDQLISKSYADERRKLIKGDRASRNYPAGEIEHGNTIYLTTADKDGNMVSLIQSNFRGMGSGMVPPGLGFMLQDRGELFSLEEGHYNVYEPGKRPFHTIIPAFITKDGQPFMAYGVMGGAMQPQGHVQIMTNIIDFGMGVQEAGDAPRIQHKGSSQPTGEKMTDGGRLVLESGFDYEVIRELMRRRHRVGFDLGSYGGYQAIMYNADQGVYYGASESRKDGQAVGY